jgi:uncharacterized protein YoxC
MWNLNQWLVFAEIVLVFSISIFLITLLAYIVPVLKRVRKTLDKTQPILEDVAVVTANLAELSVGAKNLVNEGQSAFFQAKQAVQSVKNTVQDWSSHFMMKLLGFAVEKFTNLFTSATPARAPRPRKTKTVRRTSRKSIK